MSDVKVPIKVWIDADDYRELERFAKKRGLGEVGQLLTLIASTSVAKARARAARPASRQWVRITPERRARMAALSKLGMTCSAIAKDLGVSEQSVRNHLTAMGLR